MHQDFPTQAGDWLERVEAARQSYPLLQAANSRLIGQFPMLSKGHPPSSIGDLDVQRKAAIKHADSAADFTKRFSVMLSFALVGLISYFIVTASVPLGAVFFAVLGSLAGLRRISNDIRFGLCQTHTKTYYQSDVAISTDPNNWIVQAEKDPSVQKEIKSNTKWAWARYGIAILAFGTAASYNYYRFTNAQAPAPAVVPHSPVEKSDTPDIPVKKSAARLNASTIAILQHAQNTLVRG